MILESSFFFFLSGFDCWNPYYKSCSSTKKITTERALFVFPYNRYLTAIGPYQHKVLIWCYFSRFWRIARSLKSHLKLWGAKIKFLFVGPYHECALRDNRDCRLLTSPMCSTQHLPLRSIPRNCKLSRSFKSLKLTFI